MIHITCPRCREKLEVPGCLAGTTDTCPNCQYSVPIPTPATGGKNSAAAAAEPPKPDRKPIYGAGVAQKHVHQACRELMLDDEIIEAMVSGRVKEEATKTKGRFGFFNLDSDKGGSLLKNYLIVTNRRVILWARGVLNSSVDAFEFSDIKSVEIQKGIVFGAIVLNVYGKTENFAEMNKKEALAIVEIIRRKVQQCRAAPAGAAVQATVDPTEQLERLARLYQQGMLTEDEFAQQKAKLLGQM